SKQWQTVIADGCVAVVLETSARCFALEQGPTRWIRASAVSPRSGEAIGPVDHLFDGLGIVRSDSGEIIFDLRSKFRHTNSVIKLELRIEQPFRKPYVDYSRACFAHGVKRRFNHPIDIRI